MTVKQARRDGSQTKPVSAQDARRPAAKPIRIPQAQKAATTRSKLIEAAIRCLHVAGYAATGVVQVATEAGVSRGAMSHQFPTKADLMIAVVQHVFDMERAAYRRSMEQNPPLEWLAALPGLMWDMLRRPSGLAVIEIMLAARSDDELADKLFAIQSEIEANAKAGVLHQFEAAGIEIRPDFDAMQQVIVAAIRGLTIEAAFMKGGVDAEAAITLIKELMMLLYPQLRDRPS